MSHHSSLSTATTQNDNDNDHPTTDNNDDHDQNHNIDHDDNYNGGGAQQTTTADVACVDSDFLHNEHPHARTTRYNNNDSTTPSPTTNRPLAMMTTDNDCPHMDDQDPPTGNHEHPQMIH